MNKPVLMPNSSMLRQFASLLMFAVVGLLTVACPVATADSAASNSAKWKWEVYQHQLQKRQEAIAWIRAQNPARAAKMRKLYESVLEGNRTDLVTNRKFAQRFTDMAAKAAQANQIDSSVKYRQVADIFTQLAETNQQLIQAIEAGDSVAIAEGYARVGPLEINLKEITGKDLRRSWLTAEEMQNPPPPPPVMQSAAPARPVARPPQSRR